MSTTMRLSSWQAKTALAFARQLGHGWASLRETGDNQVLAWLEEGNLDALVEAVRTESPDWPGITPTIQEVTVAFEDDTTEIVVFHTTQSGRIEWEIWPTVAIVKAYRPGNELVLQASIDADGVDWHVMAPNQFGTRHVHAIEDVLWGLNSWTGPKAPAEIWQQAEDFDKIEALGWANQKMAEARRLITELAELQPNTARFAERDRVLAYIKELVS